MAFILQRGLEMCLLDWIKLMDIEWWLDLVEGSELSRGNIRIVCRHILFSNPKLAEVRQTLKSLNH